MKPIEIHIEGYKIVISEDKERKDESLTVPVKDEKPFEPYIPPITVDKEWWKYPYVTTTGTDKPMKVTLDSETTTTKEFE